MSVCRYSHDPPPLSCHNCLTCRMAVEVLNCHNCLQLSYGSWWTQLLYGSCHNCRMAVATTAVWQLSQLPYGSCHNCRMVVATNCLLPQSSPQTASTSALAVIPFMLQPQTASYRSQLPKLPQQQLTVIPVMLRSPNRLNFPLSPTKKNDS